MGGLQRGLPDRRRHRRRAGAGDRQLTAVTHRRGEQGSGLVPTVGGVTVFLALLLFAANLLLYLQTTSAVRAVAFDTARRVAGGAAAATPEARTQAEAGARRVLGGAGGAAIFDWSGSSADTVRLRIEVGGPRLLPAPLAARAGLDRVGSTVTVRVERFRDPT